MCPQLIARCYFYDFIWMKESGNIRLFWESILAVHFEMITNIESSVKRLFAMTEEINTWRCGSSSPTNGV